MPVLWLTLQNVPDVLSVTQMAVNFKNISQKCAQIFLFSFETNGGLPIAISTFK